MKNVDVLYWKRQIHILTNKKTKIKSTFRTPLYPPWIMPSSITSRHTWCWGICGAVLLACCRAVFRISRASDKDPILSVRWRERTHGLRLSAMAKAHCRDTFSNSPEDTMESIRPSFFPSSESIGFDDWKTLITLLKFNKRKIKNQEGRTLTRAWCFLCYGNKRRTRIFLSFLFFTIPPNWFDLLKLFIPENIYSPSYLIKIKNYLESRHNWKSNDENWMKHKQRNQLPASFQ